MKIPEPTRKKDQRGQSLVEMAIILPLLLFMLAAVVNFGWLFHHQLTLTQACREAVRRGAVGQTDEKIVEALRFNAPSLRSEGLHWEITPPQDSRIASMAGISP